MSTATEVIGRSRSDFGRRLNSARKALGLNQIDFAARVGISKGTLSRYEIGALSPSTEKLSLMVAALEGTVTADWLLFGDQDHHDHRDALILKNTGTVLSLKFDRRGGAALVEFNTSELLDFFDCYKSYEEIREAPDPEVLQALELIMEHFSGCPLIIMAEPRIAVNGGEV